ncbi:hypothetical protein BC939DRAFT_441543 [Gamsiella multidivaricata]|uniref:uncharacterized protein n=1 Tax=Gamsiella multidivaricata TaxID=101098 RepID=UPI00221F37D4|nr:uncharacterized protein BC939DRAFT_441543 [Gamsiella multidivaricata]KAI7829316.1 hypothetical protein BC939DRAFT_441543 [Gamsiella multidivaricata]
MTHPLDLHEIRSNIGRFLHRGDLVRCSLVSQDWYDSFSPLLWHHISINDTDQRPPIDQLQARSRLIRSIVYRGRRVPSTYYRLKDCTHLESLKVTLSSAPHHNWQTAQLESLIGNNANSLQHIELLIRGWMPLRPPVFRAIGTCQRLRTLMLKEVALTKEGFLAVLEAAAAATGLVELQLEEVDLPVNWACADLGGNDPMENARLTRIQNLRLNGVRGMEPSGQIALMKLCPDLRSIFWRRYRNTGRPVKFAVEMFNAQVHQGTWPQLRRMDFLGEEFLDVRLVELFQALPRAMEELMLKKTGFGPLSFDALVMSSFYRTVRKVDLYACSDVSSPMIRQMLVDMEGLEDFSTGKVFVGDLFEGYSTGSDGGGGDNPLKDGSTHKVAKDIAVTPAWGCHRIRSLRLFIDMDGAADPETPEFYARQRAVYRQLAALKLLETLDVTRYVAQPLPRYALRKMDHRLSAGLDILGSLKRMKCFLFTPGQKMGMEEVDWMLETWKCLRNTSRTFTLDTELNEQLTERLVQNRVITMSFL